MNVCRYRVALLLALSSIGLPIAAGGAGKGKPLENAVFKGRVVPLEQVAAEYGIKLDPDAKATWLVLAGVDGKIYPLIKDVGSRMFFQDKRLHNRSMRLTARRVPGSNLLQVINVHSYLKGVLHDVYYWCDICTIRGYQNVICDCCGAPMELRETPAKEK